MIVLDVLDLLRRAREIISSPENWTTGSCARDANGNRVAVRNKAATCFCSVGALIAAQVLTGDAEMDHEIRRCRQKAKFLLSEGVVRTREFFSGDIAIFNDTHSHAEVLSKWDEAIANLEARA